MLYLKRLFPCGHEMYTLFHCYRATIRWSEVIYLYLERLRLKNFRCYESLEIEFDNRLAVVVGGNGAGKTTILEGAMLALSTMFIALDNLSGRSIIKSDAHLKSYHMGNTDDIQVQYPVEIYAEGGDFLF